MTKLLALILLTFAVAPAQAGTRSADALVSYLSGRINADLQGSALGTAQESNAAVTR